MGMPNDFTMEEYRRCLGKKPLPMVAFGTTASIATASAIASDRGYRVDAILPGTPEESRAKKVARFQAGKIEILFVNTHLAHGMNLSRGETIIYLDAISPHIRRQCEGRVRRLDTRMFHLAYGSGAAEAIKRLKAMSREEQLAYCYGMSPERLKQIQRRERRKAIKKWLWKWVGGTILCFITLC